MTDCTTKAYDGCSCAPVECQSITIQLDDNRRRYDAAVEGYQNALVQAVCAFTGMISVGALVMLAAFSIEGPIKRQDLRMQEIWHPAILMQGGLRHD